MQGLDGSSALGGYQPVGTAPPDSRSKPAAMVGLIASALYGLGVFLPYYSGDGESFALSDGGNEVYAIFLLPAIVGIAAAVMAMSSGSATAAGVAAGAAVGAFGLTQFFVAFSYRFVSDFEGVSYGVGFYAHTAAVVLA